MAPKVTQKNKTKNRLHAAEQCLIHRSYQLPGLPARINSYTATIYTRHYHSLSILAGSTIPEPLLRLLPNHKLGTIILRAPLRNRHGRWLMIPGCYHGAYSIHPTRQPPRDLGAQPPLAIARVIHPLEEGKLCRIRWGQRLQAANLLDGNMAVADDIAVLV